MPKLDTLKVELKVNGESKVFWTTLGDFDDFNIFKFGIDKLFDQIEERHSN